MYMNMFFFFWVNKTVFVLGIARDWTIYKKIEDPEMVGTAINCIQLHPRERRLLVHTRDNIIRMFDLRMYVYTLYQKILLNTVKPL